jgi:hypothetical protein
VCEHKRVGTVVQHLHKRRHIVKGAVHPQLVCLRVAMRRGGQVGGGHTARGRAYGESVVLEGQVDLDNVGAAPALQRLVANVVRVAMEQVLLP